MHEWEKDGAALAGLVPQRIELLTDQFYAWERRGRGWQVWDYPVVLEPPFTRFGGHVVPAPEVGIDDGRKPTLLSRLTDSFRRREVGRQAPTVPNAPLDLEDVEPEPDEDDAFPAEIRVSVPPTLKVSHEAAVRWLLGLPAGSGPLAFEILGLPDSIAVQVVCREPAFAPVSRELAGYFPEAVLTREGDVLSRAMEAAGGERVIVDFGLAREFMLPLRTVKGFDVDPLIAVVAALSDIAEGELGLLQVLFQPVRERWVESVLRSVLDEEGHPFFLDAPELTRLAREKVSLPLFACVLRLAACTSDADRSWQIVRALGGALKPLANPTGNELIPLANDEYDDVDHEQDLLGRRSRRSGMLLSSEELVTLVHPPSVSVKAERLVRQVRKTKAAPAIATGKGLVLGTNSHGGKKVEVALSAEQRFRHLYVIGAPGTGKSTLLLNCILQDLERGEGIAVLDPHGDLIDRILGHVPDERIDDVVLVDPADADWPVGFNILSAHSELERTLLSSDFTAVFRRLATSWGDQMTSVLGNAVLAFLENPRGGTLLDLKRFLVEKRFRAEVLATVTDPHIAYYWQHEFPLLRGNSPASILTRLDTFLRPKLIRHMVAQKEGLDFRRIMDEGKILLCRLSQGAIGEENAYLLGTLLVAKLQQIAMSRQDVAEEERRPFHLYIDEFHNFVTPTMEHILSGTRKYRLDLVLAHQDLRQLASRSPEVLSSVIANPYTRICFRIGDHDARTLAEGFASFEAQDLQNLSIGEALVRIERADFDFNLDTPPLPAVDAETASKRREAIVARSREKYARKREEVEALIQESLPAPLAVEQPERVEPVLGQPPAAPAAPAAEPRPVRQRAAKPKEPIPPLPPEALPSRSPGRGGQQHKYLQNLIRLWAEARGWRATIEERILDGLGNVDVALRKGELSVACEIGVSTSPEHELENIEKCLAGGFGVVVLVSPERKTLGKIRALTEKALNDDQRTRVHFRTPEEVFEFVVELEAEAAGTEGTVRGYKVKTKHRPVTEQEKVARTRRIGQTIAKAMKRLRGTTWRDLAI